MLYTYIPTLWLMADFLRLAPYIINNQAELR